MPASNRANKSDFETLTGFDRKTITRRLEKLDPIPNTAPVVYDTRKALRLLFSVHDNGQAVETNQDAARALNIAKEEQIRLEMEIKRGDRIPLDLVLEVEEEALSAIAAIIKRHEGKTLDALAIKDMLTALRERGDKIQDRMGVKRDVSTSLEDY